MPDRLIRDELLTSERYWSVSPEARNLYISVLLSADDTGRYTASSFALRTKCMAGTVSPERIEKLLIELVDVDLVRLYEDGPGRYLFIPRYRQRLRYPHSKYPDPPKGINDISEIKTVLSQSVDSPKPAEEKRSEEKRREEIHTPRFALPDWVPKDEWQQFEESRTKLRKPLTDNSRRLALRDLEKAGGDPATVIEMAVLKGWLTFYPLKKEATPVRPDL